MAITVSKKLLRIAGKTNAEFKLIGEGDKVLVGLSGGKDSLALVHVLKHMQRHAPFKFTFEAVTINYGMPGEQYHALSEHCKEHEIIHHVFETNIFDVSQDAIRPNSSFCSYFSRMRRGALYSYAEQGDFNKVALGHHFDDMAESYFMNMFYNGTMRTLAPIYKAQRGFHLIRPLIMVRESQTRGFVEDNGLVAIGDEACPAMLKDVKAPYARAKTKQWLRGMEMENKNLFKMLQSSLSTIHDDTFLDPKRWRRDDNEVMV
ncbi:MAG TPA: tRNA 2-thiocytidine biosynthesis TtcA family protein [Sulfurovum sp.]|nr:MAG: tRNA 2-thiocytidine(32) synthetase TtcA [Sulfurovum sp. 35-42-20]OYZ26047.1 MAG: tRNA 2-thiocytidine(32) synthetase TtcA [Sulfurovum sp. 16-42-52]OYZ50437.1 MAG: tRNA 2-thiocytidine(32) synthetase TtcA [Sulfurovum sp. 24-42-9]OZA46017.1 MAG: tRNA 2-thiocytidine(32) synthetase TtcA [Sulfurovum sp. 17-42-90]OZA60324.1 MAG: tRNA 2-thiocytidine(32) synthetase TtcA [Sulfurovum sp. 39-42-12]HQR73357.1 tRNA 2-thiocytidine biosynthesis TtcA family protein [Sulfurovum sp.]